MPNNPRKENPARTFRAEDELWDAATEAAAWNDESMSQVIRRALREYVAKTKAKRAKT